jgi:hypothetical protein
MKYDLFTCILEIFYWGCVAFHVYSLNYMIYAFKCINLIPYMLIWAMFDCTHKQNQIRVKYHKLEGAKEKKRGAN